ncbi:MAG TPA: endonuclease/exonuclease/phosphatase family protein [Vicinamibacterales bacterium]|nr:endonuclease/exonuclease/phosphatase family protein [Vicinamibacterales bacterium]
MKSIAITVLVLNMHAGMDATLRDNLGRVAALIRDTRADVVLLQEVDRHTRRSRGVDQPAVLERLTGLRSLFGRTLDYDGGTYGIAVLARGDVTGELVPLRVDPPQARAGGSTEPRGVLVSTVVLKNGATIRVLNTHLDASREEHYRLQEVDRLLASIADLPQGGSLIAGGDFNATPDSEAYARLARAGLRDAWQACGKGGGLTYPTAGPVKRIDYLFMGEGVDCAAAEIPSFDGSDHRPLLVRLRVR